MAVAEAAAPAREVNYRARGSLRFGKFTREVVMPRWWVERSGQSADRLVREGVLEETMEPVVADFRAPEPQGGGDPGPAMAEENNALRKENSRLRAEGKGLAANNDALRAKEAAQTVALGDLTAQVAHWRQQAEAYRAAAVAAEKRVADLESELELERATKPADAKGDKKK